MNRYDRQFRALPALVRVNAAQRAGYARGALIEHRSNGFGPDDDDAIVRQFDLSGMAEFWDVVLSEPMEAGDFAHALAVHFMVIEHKLNATAEDMLASGAAASRAVDAVRAQLRGALRKAYLDGEPWFVEMPELPSTKLDAKAWLGFVPSDTYIELPPPPADGVDLSRLKVRPRPAVEWLIAMPKRRHLVPPSLVAILRPTSRAVELEAPKRGRPKGTSLAKADTALAESMNTMVAAGDAPSPTAAAWSLIGRNGSGANGTGTPDAKVKRLVGVAKALRESQKKAD